MYHIELNSTYLTALNLGFAGTLGTYLAYKAIKSVVKRIRGDYLTISPLGQSILDKMKTSNGWGIWCSGIRLDIPAGTLYVRLDYLGLVDIGNLTVSKRLNRREKKLIFNRAKEILQEIASR